MTDYRDNMTLDEMAENDTYMTEVAVKNANRYTFYNVDQARQFAIDAGRQALARLGIILKPGISPKFVDKKMKKENVKVEYREKYKGKDQWRCGQYIYKDGELVAFVSSVFHDEPSPLSINREDKFYVITNARMK